MKRRLIFRMLPLVFMAFILVSCADLSGKEEEENVYYVKEHMEHRKTQDGQDTAGIAEEKDDDEELSGEAIKTESKIPLIRDVEELRDYLYENLENGILVSECHYTGSDFPTPQMINQMLCVTYCQTEMSLEDPFFQRIVVTEYPGDRMVRAHYSGDWSNLSEDEKNALTVAEDIVKKGQEIYSTDLMMEKYIHDWICSNVDYYDGSTEYTDTSNIPHHLNAVGALIDGKVNCQGYADCFYVLGNLSGLNVKKMSCYNKSLQESHVMNIIQLNGEWSVVDVTFDDINEQLQEQEIFNYRLFNAGKDIAMQEHEWDELLEYYPVAEETPEEYFYYTPEDEKYKCFGQAYQDISSMAESVAEQYEQEGRKVFYLMLQGIREEDGKFDEALNEQLNARGVYFQRNTYRFCVNDTTYFSVIFQ